MVAIFQLLALTLLLIISNNAPLYAAILNVPNSYATITQAVNAAGDGDTIAVTAGHYTNGIVATISQNNLTIKGIGGIAHLDAGNITISNGKAIFVTTGNNIVLENIEFSNAKVNDENGAGIRHEGGLLTVSHCFFHDNENGILTSNQGSGGELVVEYSEFNHNGLGDPGYTHNIYVGKIERFTFRYSFSHHATHGHNIKSRAAENYILYSRIMDEALGNASYQIDLPIGGLSYLIGNTLQQGAQAENSVMVSYASENTSNPIQELYLSANTLVNDRPSGIGLRLKGTPSVYVVNNIFDSCTVAVDGVATLFTGNLVGNNSGFVNRTQQNFHLTPQSAARDSAGTSGIYNGYDLTPIYEYVHPLKRKIRTVDSQQDRGAFEYEIFSPPPGTGGVNITPQTYLLLDSN